MEPRGFDQDRNNQEKMRHLDAALNRSQPMFAEYDDVGLIDRYEESAMTSGLPVSTYMYPPYGEEDLDFGTSDEYDDYDDDYEGDDDDVELGRDMAHDQGKSGTRLADDVP